VAALLGGCAGGTIIPSDGPTGQAVRAKAEVTVDDVQNGLSYALVRLTPTVIELAQTEQYVPVFPRPVVQRASADIRVGIGDSLSITVFEAGAGGLFIPIQAGSRPGNFVQLPNQQIDQSGNITVPYAGSIRAVGRMVSDIQKEIENKLANRAIEPQIIVHTTERRANDISVLGDVNNPARFSMDPGGIRVLGAIARAGGPRFQAYESVVALQRGGRVDQVPLTTIVKFPEENVQLMGGDVVFVSRQQKYFLAFGGTGPFSSLVGSNNRRLPFEDDNLTLAEGVAKAGGLESDRSDPRSVFLYRLERRPILEQLGVDISRMPGPLVPTIYMVDLKEPEGYFLANNFFMKNKDMIFVSDAPSVDIIKFMQLISSVTNTVRDVTGAARDIQNFNIR
jgi:polysaccharide export outer membrane protein